MSLRAHTLIITAVSNGKVAINASIPGQFLWQTYRIPQRFNGVKDYLLGPCCVCYSNEFMYTEPQTTYVSYA